MDTMHIKSYYYETQIHPPMAAQAYSPSSQSSLSIVSLAIIGIISTAFLLIGYYVFVIKCCANMHRFDIISPFIIYRSRRHRDPMIMHASETHGLDESKIRSIPTLRFRKMDQKNSLECAVCLNEFQEEEKLRILPNCAHVFHIDCIDVWLQNNINCPLCRTSISMSTTEPPPIPIISTTTLHDQDFVVMEVREGDSIEETIHGGGETSNSEDVSAQLLGKVDKKVKHNKDRKFDRVLSMGDECIHDRAKDERFSVQPIRRSVSMDSAVDRELLLSIRETIQQNRHLKEVRSEGCSSSSSSSATKLRRSIFSFRGSRNAVLPVQFEQENY